jgi:hypothetical protein
MRPPYASTAKTEMQGRWIPPHHQRRDAPDQCVLKFVVRCLQHDRAVYLKECLSGLVGLLDVPLLHLAYPILGPREGFCKRRIEHEALAASLAGAVGRIHLASALAGEQESESSLSVRRSRSAMAAGPPSQGVRATHVKILARRRKE